ncbi:hypothetical protein HERIO_673 [Hepatospora eriocheir]|uniref:Uncharacterized protein n=1 Tax=Hepatospora eriocheir TaxID=1081669 RepID=A0A1X0QCC9_9MICR|nr:hypothetical protein HERIO_673 [Hepatospora eriocheir]
MTIITEVVREVIKQFYLTFIYEYIIIKENILNIHNIIIGENVTKSLKMVSFLMSMFIIFCIIIGFFALNDHVKGIAIAITRLLLVNELVSTVSTFNLKYLQNENYKQNNKSFIDDIIRKFPINEVIKEEDFEKSSPFNLIYENLENSRLKTACFLCVDFLMHIIICEFSKRYNIIDESLIFLVLTNMSLKTCLSFYLCENQSFLVFFKIAKHDIFYLIILIILFILSMFVKLVRDILVSVILSVFYSIILSLFISIICYNKDNLIDSLELLLLNTDGNKKREEIDIEFLFMGCFLLYLIVMFFTRRLFWKK